MAENSGSENRIEHLSVWCDWIARSAVMGMVLLVCSNIILRFFGRPWLGTYETVSFLGVIIVAMALPYCSVKKGHIAVDLVYQKFPQRTQVFVDIFTKILSLFFFVIVCWRTFEYGTKMMKAGEITMTQRWAFYPFIYVIAFCSLILCLVLFLDLLKSSRKAVRK